MVNYFLQVDSDKLMRYRETVMLQQDQFWKLSEGKFFIKDSNGERYFNHKHPARKVFADCLCPVPDMNVPFISLCFKVDEDPSAGEGNCLTIYEKLGELPE
jgi:hypothetical protein